MRFESDMEIKHFIHAPLSQLFTFHLCATFYVSLRRRWVRIQNLSAEIHQRRRENAPNTRPRRQLSRGYSQNRDPGSSGLKLAISAERNRRCQTPLGGATVMRNAIRTNELASFEKKPIALSLRLGMSPGAWRPGLEPAELSFRVPHFFHQTRRGTRGTIIIYYAEFPGRPKNVSPWLGES
jgi:hypothetical protein